MTLTHSQVTDLADPFVAMIDSLVEFFKDPENKSAYQKWYREKYGCEPEMEVEV